MSTLPFDLLYDSHSGASRRCPNRPQRRLPGIPYCNAISPGMNDPAGRARNLFAHSRDLRPGADALDAESALWSLSIQPLGRCPSIHRAIEVGWNRRRRRPIMLRFVHGRGARTRVTHRPAPPCHRGTTPRWQCATARRGWCGCVARAVGLRRPSAFRPRG